jgi:hypothetical protein
VAALKDSSLTSTAAAKVIRAVIADTDPDSGRALPFRDVSPKAVANHRTAGHK